MSFYEAWKRNPVSPVDDFRARRRDISPHHGDHTVAHKHIAARQIADLGVHAHDVSVTYHEFTARRQADAG